MDLVDFIAGYGGWSWIVFGLVLLAIELIAPGVFMVWLGGAAIATGLATIATGMGWPWQWGTFGVLSLVLVSGWLAYSRKRWGKNPPSEVPLLNRRTARYLGREVVLVEPISDGFGRVQIGDTLWRVSGPALPEGTTVRVTGAEGAVLIVEPVR